MQSELWVQLEAQAVPPPLQIAYGEQLAAHALKVLSPSEDLKTGLQQIGERLTAEWLTKAGADGQAVIDAYKKRRLISGPPSPKLAGARRFSAEAP